MSTGDWKYKADYSLPNIYRFYKKKQKGLKKPVIEEFTFSKIIRSFNTEVCEAIVDESFEYRMPYRLGYLRIRKHKTRLVLDADGKLKTGHLHPNWVATKALWEKNEEAKESKKIIWHTNKHTQGFYCKWYWDKTVCNIRNSSVYSLVMSRTNKRKIAKAIKTNDKIDYYE